MTMTNTTEQSYAERTITETTEVGDVPLILAAQGLTISSVTRRGGVYLATLRAHRWDGVDERIDAATGTGPTLASALEDARQGWARWRDGYLRRRSPATGEHEASRFAVALADDDEQALGLAEAMDRALDEALADVLGACSAEGDATTTRD